MPITLREKIDSRASQSGQSPTVTLIYDLEGTANDLTAKAQALATAPVVYDNLLRQSVSLEPIVVDEVADTGHWLVSVRYGASAPQTAGQSSFSFDTSGGTQHITQSIATRGKYPAGTAPDFQGAIGVTHDSVQGADITSPVFGFTVNRTFSPAQMTPTLIAALYAATGKVNNATFAVNVDGVELSFAAGECLFQGASGSKRGGENWEIAYRFAASPNATNLTIGTITGVNKKGWEYLWVRYVDDEDAASSTVVKKPAAVYIEQVYVEGDFSGLGV